MNSSIPLAYWLMPEQLILPVALMLGILGLFIRLVGLRRFGSSLMFAAAGLAILPVLLAPVLEEIMLHIPIWAVLLFIFALGLYLVRMFLMLFLGREAVGVLLAMFVVWCTRLFGAFLGLIARWTPATGALLSRPGPVRRLVGIAVAILLAVVAGIGSREFRDTHMAGGDYLSSLAATNGGFERLFPGVTDPGEEARWINQ